MITLSCIQRMGVALAAAAAAFAAVPAASQSYPARPVEMVIHTNPGGGQDVFGRLLAEINMREKLLPQPFSIVYNIHVGGGRGFSMPAGVPKETAAVMEAALERAHKSALWRDYSTKNMYEDTYMGSAAFSQYLAKTLPIIGEFMETVSIKKQ